MYLKSMRALSKVCSSTSSLFLSFPDRSSLSMNFATSSAGLQPSKPCAEMCFEVWNLC